MDKRNILENKNDIFFSYPEPAAPLLCRSPLRGPVSRQNVCWYSRESEQIGADFCSDSGKFGLPRKMGKILLVYQMQYRTDSGCSVKAVGKEHAAIRTVQWQTS
ncbi:hypothetical protein AVEN_82812-1 [Araneus ventricosus]|uniref:Uncharacterized protein n=1 Tax=Araneus ventricosus TaxID=182803 RepID=A0A4Y2MZN7_ARAVE|nr:hypothetical protein AVEN_82812-1 [Araneus ventricosus]